MARVLLARFEAINAVEHRYAPYLFTGQAQAGASADAAAVTAATSVLTSLFPDHVSAVQAAYAESIARIPDGDSKTAGIKLGREVGAACIAARENDGSG